MLAFVSLSTIILMGDVYGDATRSIFGQPTQKRCQLWWNMEATQLLRGHSHAPNSASIAKVVAMVPGVVTSQDVEVG